MSRSIRSSTASMQTSSHGLMGQRIVVMGVAGSGKSTIGERIAHELGAGFVDADDLHPTANVEKMAAGNALSDEDRWPWLAAVAEELSRSTSIVVSCSALKRSYRSLLRRVPNVRFVMLEIEPELAVVRANQRADHFMAASMVDSQFAALEIPDSTETDVAIVDASPTVSDVVAAALHHLGDTQPRTV